MHCVWIVFVFLMVTGCTNTLVTDNKKVNTNDLPEINYALYDSSQATLPEIKSLFKLSKSQEQEFLTFYQQELLKDVKPNRALYNFLSIRLDEFTYFGETLLPEETMGSNKGNCLSLAILTTALANVVNLEVAYRKVTTIPIYEKKNNILLSSSHVQTVVYDPTFKKEEGFFYFQKPAVVIDYFSSPSNRLTSGIIKNSLVARYFSNLASKYLYEGDLNSAFSFAEQAYKLDQSSTEILNLLAVLHRRKGDNDSAEKFYLYAIKAEPKNINLLKNYIVLLNSQQRFDESNSLELMVEGMDDPNPYNWLEQAYIAQHNHKLKQAEKYFKKTITVAPYLHKAYLGLYQVYLSKGQYARASKILTSALPWAYDEKDKHRYNAKLFSLSQRAL